MSSFFSWCSTQAKNDILHYVRNGLLKKLPLCEETTFIKYIMNEVTTPFIAPCGLWKKTFYGLSIFRVYREIYLLYYTVT